MSSSEPIDLLIRGAATLLGAPGFAIYDNREAWLVALDDETMFDIEHDAAMSRLVMSGAVVGDIQVVPEAVRGRLYEVLLQYNYLWTESGSVRMALDGTPGQVVMMFDLSLAGLEVSGLCTALSNMSAIQRAWRELVEVMIHKPEPGTVDGTPSLRAMLPSVIG